MNRLYIAIVLLLLMSACNTSKHVHSKRLIQKRKYTSGWHFKVRKGFKSGGITVERMDEKVNVDVEALRPRKAIIEASRTQLLKTIIEPIKKWVHSKNIEEESNISVSLPQKDELALVSTSERKNEQMLSTSTLISKNKPYMRFGVNDAETTLWIGVICLVLGLIALAFMGSTPHLALSFLFMLAGTVLVLIGVVNLIVGLFRSIL